MNKHLNLFYTYGTYHLEDNITRALMITLANLRPVHLRLFLREVIVHRAPHTAGALHDRLDLLARPEFSFDVQLTSLPGDEKLTEETGLLVGITASGNQNLILDQQHIASGGARPDAILSDEANGLTVIFETKLSDAQYHEQLERHFRNFFDASGTSLKRVFVEVSWSDIGNFLEVVRTQSRGSETDESREAFVCDQFLDYLDLNGLGEFRGFRREDLDEHNAHRFQRFLRFLAARLPEALALQPYEYGGKFLFNDIRRENLWWDAEHNCGLVCGAAGIWRAQALQGYVRNKKAEFNLLLQTLRSELDPSFQINLRVHSYFRAKGNPRFGGGWLGDVRGISTYPKDFDRFWTTITDPEINSFKYCDKATINRIFATEIQTWKPKLDGQGLFPNDKANEFLQYCYFHVDVEVPRERLVRSTPDETVDLFAKVIGGLRRIALSLNSV